MSERSEIPGTDYSKGGVLLIDKPLGWTSFDVVGKVRNLLKHKYGIRLKVGHAGTLDPLATGLLIICTGAFTKKINEYQDLEKKYEGIFTLGAFRPSFDRETEITETSPVSHITEAFVKKTSEQFIGEIEQIPPVHSAIKVDGKRAYESARKGKEIEMLPRKIFIKSMEVELISPTQVSFKVVCSKGTYIRSLARDFGIALNSAAYLESLCRTHIGQYKLEDATTIEEFAALIGA